jgi:hypothetical protein
VGPKASVKILSTVNSLLPAGNATTIPQLSTCMLDAVRNDLRRFHGAAISALVRAYNRMLQFWCADLLSHVTMLMCGLLIACYNVDVRTSYRMSGWSILWQCQWLRLYRSVVPNLRSRRKSGSRGVWRSVARRLYGELNNYENIGFDN